MSRLVVVGAGITGLTAAFDWHRARPADEIVVLEASSRIGGKLDRVRLAGQWYDTGPEAMLARVPEAVQLFDSWAGVLSAADYAGRVLPHSRAVFDGLGDRDAPRIHFGVGTGELLPLIGDAGADVVGVDWRVPLDEAARRVGPGYSLQGNLDPAVLLADRATVDREVTRVVEQGRAARGHVFNLGHGVLPDTDPGVLTSVVDLVHELSTR